MKYVKILGLLAVAAVTLMASAGTASATLTSPYGTPYGSTIHATNEGHVSLTGSFTITCTHSTFHGQVNENTATTVGVSLTSLTFSNCNEGKVTVTTVEPGLLTAHSTGTNTATVTSKYAKLTVLLHSAFLGTVHCTYITPSTGTDIGTLTGSGHGANTRATIDTVASIQIEAATSDFGCGSHATWHGNYEILTPTHPHID